MQKPIKPFKTGHKLFGPFFFASNAKKNNHHKTDSNALKFADFYHHFSKCILCSAISSLRKISVTSCIIGGGPHMKQVKLLLSSPEIAS